MRKFLAILIVFTVFTLFPSCRKDNNVDQSTQIVGRWQMTQMTMRFGADADTQEADPEFPNFLTFNVDGTVITDFYNSEFIDGREEMVREVSNGRYVLSSDGRSLTLTDDDSDDTVIYTVHELTNTNLRVSAGFDGLQLEMSFRKVQ